MVMNKNLTVQAGNCNHRRYLPALRDLVLTGVVDPTTIITQVEDATVAIAAYEAVDQRQPGWLKVVLDPAS